MACLGARRRTGGLSAPVGGRCGKGDGLGADPLGVGHVGRRRDVLVLAATEQRDERRQEARRIAERPIGVEVEREEVLAQEDDRLGARQHTDVRREAELQRVLADHPVSEGMERRDRAVRVAVRDELVDPHRHLVGGLVGEGQGEDLGRLRALRRDQPRDPAGDHLGLAGARPRDDEQWPLPVRHRAELVRIEAAEQGIHPVRRAALDESRIHDGHQVAPGRDLLERDGPTAPGADGRTGHGPDARRDRGLVDDGGHVRTIDDRRDT